MTFAEFFEAVWDKNPFPWQEQLAGLAMEGRWPASIGLPTAAGKTALIDIAVFALAMRAPKAARRIFFVVDRRVIVDDAAERAASLALRLSEADPNSDLGKIAQALRSIGGTAEPLATAVLRGGIPRDDSWTDSPLQPVVICSTVDQIGSNLLFRGYGASEYGWPVRAGLAGCDALIILDEAHTSQPFAQTLGWISRYRDWAEQRLDLPFTVVEMSATPREGEVFSEQDADRADPLLKQRWEAEKRAKLVPEDPRADEQASEGGFTALVERLVQEAREMRDEGGAKVIGVIANRVLTARRIHEALKDDEGCDAILLTGRSRPYDRDRIWQMWKPSIGLDRKGHPEKPIFVVATQCIEVGANIDFDALVTEIASVDALEQRFGRLDRNGNRVLTHAAIVAQKDQTKSNYDDPVYGKSLSGAWKWLKEHEVREGREKFVPMGVVTFRQAMLETPEADRAGLVMPRRNAPTLMPAHMDLLCQTSPAPAVGPEPALFLHGAESGPADVQVIWRQDLGEDTRLWGEIAEICRPSAAEAISLPIWAVRKWLSNQDTGDVADVDGSREAVVRDRSEKAAVLGWRGPDEAEVLDRPDRIRPGTTILVPASRGGCDEWGWNPASRLEVSDIGDQVKLRMRRPILRLHPKLVAGWSDPELAQRLNATESIRELRDELGVPPREEAAGWVREAVLALSRSRTLKLVDNPDGTETWAAVMGKGTFSQEGVRASYTIEIGLGPHISGCARRAGRFARELPPMVQATLARAAGLHDIGKADPRFQAWLRGGNPVKANELIAKSGRSGQNWAAIKRARTLAGYPEGGRHELLSVALLAEHGEEFAGLDFELLLHLIGSHHGRCRPFAPVVDDPDPVSVTFNRWSAPSDHCLERAGSGVCERFWSLTRRYGWYGLAYLEALVRLADYRQSESEENKEVESEEAAHA
jgi:CRISPR-associated endonuclease/helicase Cas3